MGKIVINNTTFVSWNAMKNATNHRRKSHSAFAKYLLDQIRLHMYPDSETEEEITEESSLDVDVEIECDNTVLAINNSVTLTASDACNSANVSDIVQEETMISSNQHYATTPVAGNFYSDSMTSNELELDEPCVISTPMQSKKCLSYNQLSRTHNSMFTENGDPFIGLDSSSSSSEDSEDEDTLSLSEDELNLDLEDNLDNFILEEESDGLQTFIDKLKGVNMESTSDEVNFNLSVKELHSYYGTVDDMETSHQTTDVNMSLCSNASESVLEAGLVANQKEVNEKLKIIFDKITCSEYEPELALLDRERLMVSLEQLIELKGNKCSHVVSGKLCGLLLSFHWQGRGTVRILKWKCEVGHEGKWASSEVLTIRHKTPIYLNDLLLASCVPLSGNNWTKVHLLFKFMNMCIPNSKVFHRSQNLFISPEISSFWDKMKAEILDVLSHYSEINLCGDGRNDSPGHCARFCTYVLMEHFLKIIIDLEVMDCRETQGISTRMEKDALIRLLKKIRHILDLAEITTDASTTIIKAIRDLKAEFPSLVDLIHSLDTWHKAKCLRKALCNIASTKGNEDIKPWIESIINHFWHCSQNCQEDLEQLKDMWIAVLHHVCGEHSWAGGQCAHGELQTVNDPKTPLKKNSKCMDALRDVVLDRKFMDSLKFYTRFRHTSDLENFNSMMLKYAPKRVAFDYQYYQDRMFLAAIDHNIHLFRDAAVSSNGEMLFARKYSKRSKRWHAQPLKVPKAYPHVRCILSGILRRRIAHLEPLDRCDRMENDPKLISPTIGGVPPSTKDLVREKLSRLKKI